MEILRERVKRKFILRVFSVILRDNSPSLAERGRFERLPQREFNTYRNNFHYMNILIRDTTAMESTARAEKQVAEALRNQTPVRALAGVSIANVQEQSDQQFDISFDLLSGANQIRVLAEVKSAFSPRVLEEIRPWIRRLKSLRPDVAVAVIAPQLSVQAQAFCIEDSIFWI
ncbi:MAG: hypothetical protein ABSD13_18550 [Candidatus Korobacteraceae bacterium]|jgi:hypothetical protein